MIIDTINLNLLRVFECVYRKKTMTEAAKELHLTQSGVSQHVKALEGMLGEKLFDRINQKLIPTAKASRLFKECSRSLYAMEEALSEIKGGQRQFSGTVAIGMPAEFGNNIVIPLLARFCGDHPGVRISVRYGSAKELNALILEGSLDFAFIDAFGVDKRVESRKVYDETLFLCAGPEFARKRKPSLGLSTKASRGYFESLEYIDYEENEPVLGMWFKHHYAFTNLKLNVRAVAMDVQGVARFILSGGAAGVLPGHLVASLEKQGKRVYKFAGSGKPLKNIISVAYLPNRTSAPAASAVMKWLVEKVNA